MPSNYHDDLLEAIDEFETYWEMSEDVAIGHLSVWVESYLVNHPDYQRVRWSMLALRLFIENRQLYIDPLERNAQMVLACTICRTRLAVPTWQLPMLKGELTYAIWQRKARAAKVAK